MTPLLPRRLRAAAAGSHPVAGPDRGETTGPVAGSADWLRLARIARTLSWRRQLEARARRSEDAIKPWRGPLVDFPPRPGLRDQGGPRAGPVRAEWEGEPLGDGDYVVSADEKTSIQARIRCHSSLPAAPGRAPRTEFEYDRGGALQYLAAWDVHRARVFGRCEPATGIEPFGRLLTQVMTTEPYASARRVFWVVDNGSSHRGQASIDRVQGKWPTARLIHLPVHASWINQVEIYFSVIQRKVLTPNDFTSLAEVADRLLAFERRYEQAAIPFEWRFTRHDFALLMKKLATQPDYQAAA